MVERRHVRRPSFVLSVDVPTRSAGTVSTTPSDQRIEQAWIAKPAHPTNLAYRMLGDIGAAEDAVQEAFARLLRSEPGTIDDDRAWLIVVTSRVCLDQIRSARVRLERPHAGDEVEARAATGPPGPRSAD